MLAAVLIGFQGVHSPGTEKFPEISPIFPQLFAALHSNTTHTQLDDLIQFTTRVTNHTWTGHKDIELQTTRGHTDMSYNTTHKPKDALSDYAIQSKDLLRQRCLYPWQLSLGKSISLQCHHLGQRTSKHRQHIDRRLQPTQSNCTRHYRHVTQLQITIHNVVAKRLLTQLNKSH